MDSCSAVETSLSPDKDAPTHAGIRRGAVFAAHVRDTEWLAHWSATTRTSPNTGTRCDRPHPDVVDVGQHGVAHELGRRAIDDDAPLPQRDEPVAVARGQIHVMQHHHA